MNMEIVTLENEEGPALGAAILAAVGCDEYADVYEAANRIVKAKNIYLPTAETAEKYEIKYRRFTEIYPAVKNLFR